MLRRLLEVPCMVLVCSGACQSRHATPLAPSDMCTLPADTRLAESYGQQVDLTCDRADVFPST